MARKTAVVWAAEDTAEALHAHYRAEPAAEVRTRLHGLWLVRRGESPTAVAAAVGVSRRSVQRWLGWYREGGLAAVRSRRRGGPGKPCFLTEAQQARLVAEAATGVFRTGQAVRDWLEERFGVAYTVAGVYTLMERRGLRLKTPRPQHPQADPRTQAAWKKGDSGPV